MKRLIYSLGAIAIILLIALSAAKADNGAPAPDSTPVQVNVQQPASALNVEVANVSAGVLGGGVGGIVLPVLLAIIVWVYSWLRAAKSM